MNLVKYLKQIPNTVSIASVVLFAESLRMIAGLMVNTDQQDFGRQLASSQNEFLALSLATPLILFITSTLPVFFIVKGSNLGRLWITGLYLQIFIGVPLVIFKFTQKIDWSEILTIRKILIILALALLFVPPSNRWFRARTSN